MTTDHFSGAVCPIPIQQYPYIVLAHGGGGKLMQDLIRKMFLDEKETPFEGIHDSAVMERPRGRLAFTTDSYVVDPVFFPGGDIGSMAVYGTVNDLAMSGAKPLYLSVAFILEEGFPMESLWKIVCSIRKAARRSGVKIVTGDTKVVEKGRGHGIFVNTSGVGLLEHSLNISPQGILPGDQIIINGDLGRHGIAIMAVREGLRFKTRLQSDSQPVHDAVEALLGAEIPIHCMRDLTRGGLASALNELSEASSYSMRVIEKQIAVREEVRGACEMLGLDPLHVANEGRFALFVPKAEGDRALEILRKIPGHEESVCIGEVLEEQSSIVTVQNSLGTSRIVDMLSGEQLPRIC